MEPRRRLAVLPYRQVTFKKMSQTASFYLIEANKLEKLKEVAEVRFEKKWFRKVRVDNFYKYLYANSQELRLYDWSGYIMFSLLVYLEDGEPAKSINFRNSPYAAIAKYLTNIRDTTFVILTEDHKKKYLQALHPANFKQDELAEYFTDLGQEDFMKAGKAMMEALEVLRQNLTKAEKDKVVLLIIG
jgi:hypothetical protein